MTRTLHRYLWRELVKVAGLSLVALTFIMTVLAIIEPLRKEGLAGSQVLALFAYTLPVMFSLTIPIAALFAATIVYGRFSQDNELLACSASGVSTLSLLQPALLLGAIVTVATLLLSNYVAPRIASAGEEAVRRNVRGIFCHQLGTRGYVRFGSEERYTIHADQVFPRENEIELRGFVGADTHDPRNVAVAVAATAFIRFDDYQGETYASVHMIDPAGVRTAERMIPARSASLPFSAMRLPSFARSKIAFLDWKQLLGMFNRPSLHPDVQRRLTDIHQSIRRTRLAEDIVAAVEDRRPYAKLRSGRVSYVLSAARAEVDEIGHARLFSGQDPDGRAVPVEVRVLLDGKLDRTITSPTGKVKTEWSAISDVSLATIVLDGPAQVRRAEEDASETARVIEWSSGQIAIPGEITDWADRINPQDVYDNPRQFVKDKNILATIEDLKTKRLQKILGQIIAEIHGRLAYGMSCFLMVAMGAALGIIFRGGQAITAFALSVIPAALVIVMVLMGKKLVVSPPAGVAGGRLWGLASIWSGDVALLGANIWIYLRLMRK